MYVPEGQVLQLGYDETDATVVAGRVVAIVVAFETPPEVLFTEVVGALVGAVEVVERLVVDGAVVETPL